MQKEDLKTGEYREVEKGYGEWLSRLGYNAQMVKSFPNQIREFMIWLERRGVEQVSNWDQNEVASFMVYFKQRPNQRRGGGLSVSHINKQIYALNLLFKYLKLTEGLVVDLELFYEEKGEPKVRKLLSREEIGLLYSSCGNDPLGQRDRALLSVYYGCGLRRQEGVGLELKDVLFERKLLHVRHGKNGWERYVPMVVSVSQDLERYIYGGRRLLSSSGSPEQLFISDKGGGLSGQSLLRCLKSLLDKSGLSEEIGLHSLRHCIATHLLEGGMDLEEVALFLGHRQLDSTQRYTQIKERAWRK